MLATQDTATSFQRFSEIGLGLGVLALCIDCGSQVAERVPRVLVLVAAGRVGKQLRLFLERSLPPLEGNAS